MQGVGDDINPLDLPDAAMSSNVVVIDSSFRRHTIKTTPQKPLGDVLREACAKFGYNPDQYGLKHNDKPLDLSRTIRLTNLTPGARLTLVQASKSPTVVSIALQLPPTAGPSSTRLKDKFSSDTSLWQILRRFESGAAGGEETENKNLNFTQRASVKMANGDVPASMGAAGGAGRLYYEMPTINVLYRQLESFEDLQQTLAQLGISGSAVLRLNFRDTKQPLEEAMGEIQAYFMSSGEGVQVAGDAETGTSSKRDLAVAENTAISPAVPGSAGGIASDPMDTSDQPTTMTEKTPAETEEMNNLPETDPVAVNDPSMVPDIISDAAPITAHPQSPDDQRPPDLPPSTTDDPQTHTQNEAPPMSNPSQAQPSEPPQGPTTSSQQSQPTPAPPHNLQIFAPPTSSTPSAAAALANHNEADYLPAITQALGHQANLTRSSRNVRLESDDVITARAAEKAAARAAVSTVTVQLRFPDQSRVERACGQSETVADLYGTCAQVMDLEAIGQGSVEETVELRTYAPGGGVNRLAAGSSQRLIADLGWSGRVLVNVVWRDDVPAALRGRPCLKAEYRAQAKQLKGQEVAADEDEKEKGDVEKQEGKKDDKGKKKGVDGDREARMKRLLGKMTGKK